ncbi:MAG: 30S ribosomal protein S3 [Spirochaetaceae bacterium]|jgi:small subunit ribosomal protein S3|nr:30S ribosomal protein S3 [Spirochaetaceae bacterium]
MGQKVHPYGLRLGINKTWKSKWYVNPRKYAETLHEDLALRKALEESPETRGAEIGDVEIIRQPQRVTLMIHTARPGVIIGTKGANIEKISGRLQKITDKKLQIKIKEVKRPEADAQIVALNVARQLKGRSAFRRVLKMAVSSCLKSGVQGIKIKISGRLGGAEMARTQEVKDGRIPLHTLRANIDYGFAEADTTFGKIGVKVWVFKGEVYGIDQKEDAGLLVKSKKERSSRSK